MKPRTRTALVVLAPIVSVATLMIGLRVGAGEKVRAASVFAAPPGRPAAPGAPTPLAWQILTYLEDRGVRETIPIEDLSVVARARGKEARWTGASNADGIAEPPLAIADLTTGDPVEIEVRSASESEPLARGAVGWHDVRWGSEPGAAERAAARPSRREGALGIDVLVEGERLVVGFETTLWIHVTGADPAKVALEVKPEPGLLVEGTPRLACDGWAEVRGVAPAHVIGVQIDARGDGPSGLWFGALPVAPGAFFVGMPRVIEAGKGAEAVLVAPNPRNVVYAEIDDTHGRVLAAALPLVVDATDPVPRARLPIPALAPGLHWLTVSGEPRGAERLAGAAIARPFLVVSANGVGETDGVRAGEACSVGPWLARRPATGFPRWLAIDGMATRGAPNRARHRLGLFIGLVSLLAAAILEVLLLTAASREARAVLLLADLDDPAAPRTEVTARPPGGGLAVAILVAMLGFTLLAALMIAKG